MLSKENNSLKCFDLGLIQIGFKYGVGGGRWQKSYGSLLLHIHTSFFFFLSILWPNPSFFSKKMGYSQTHFESFHACFELVMGITRYPFQAQNQKTCITGPKSVSRQVQDVSGHY